MTRPRSRTLLIACLLAVSIGLPTAGRCQSRPIGPDQAPNATESSLAGSLIPEALRRARALIGSVNDPKDRVVLLARMARLHALSGDPAAARELIDQATQLVESIGGDQPVSSPRPRRSSVRATQPAESTNGDRLELRGLALLSIARARKASGDADGTRATCLIAAEAAFKATDRVKKDHLLCDVIKTMMQMGDRDGARQVFDRAVEEINSKSMSSDDRYLGALHLVELKASLKDFQSALQAIRQLHGEFPGDSDRTKAWGLLILSNRMEESDRAEAPKVIDEALRIVADFRDADARAEALEYVARIQVEVGDPIGATRTVRMMPETDGRKKPSQGRSLLEKKAEEYATVAAALSKAGFKDEARDLCSETRQFLDELESPYRGLSESIAFSLIRIGDFRSALQLIDAPKRYNDDRGRHLYLLGTLAKAYAEAGDKARAEAAFQRAMAEARMELQIAKFDQERSTVLSDVAEIERMTGRLEDALRTSLSIAVDADKERTVQELIARMTVENDDQTALRWTAFLSSPKAKLETLVDIADLIASRSGAKAKP